MLIPQELQLSLGDPKYFTDSFKKYFDVPPSVYMKQN